MKRLALALLFVVALSTCASAPTPSAVICDGDGTSGYRVQVLYVRPVSTASRYAEYLSRFQQWAYEADKIFTDSAAQTGGVRHIRFVTDASCYPVITEAVVTDDAAAIMPMTISELMVQGFSRTDRDYLLFMDAHYGCGVSSFFVVDDSPGPDNEHNTGPHYSRVDNTCWSGIIAAHELAHIFGAVQTSAPHSDGNWHCTDSYDNLCDRSGHFAANATICPDQAMDRLLDCNHDDYFSTNPPAGSYLATHWNIANSRFLIASNLPTGVVLLSFSARWVWSW